MKNNWDFIGKKIALLFVFIASLGLANVVLARDEVIDVLVIYDTAAEQFYGSSWSVAGVARHFVAATNLYWSVSGGSFKFNLAGVVKRNMNDMGFDQDAITQLKAAKTSRTYMTELLHQVSGFNARGATTTRVVTQKIRDLRKIYEADLVVLMSDGKSSSICGRAFQPRAKVLWPSHDEFQANETSNSNFFWSTSVLDIGCGAQVFAHELGHNLGLGHSRKQGNEGTLLEAGVGYGVDGVFSTIMAYARVFNTTRISRFSNPNKLWSGVPTGVSGVEGSNAVLAARGFSVPYIMDLAGPSCLYSNTETGIFSIGGSRIHAGSSAGYYYAAAGSSHNACLVTGFGARLPSSLALEKWDAQFNSWIPLTPRPKYSQNRPDEMSKSYRTTENGYYRWAVRSSVGSGGYTLYF